MVYSHLDEWERGGGFGGLGVVNEELVHRYHALYGLVAYRSSSSSHPPTHPQTRQGMLTRVLTLA